MIGFHLCFFSAGPIYGTVHAICTFDEKPVVTGTRVVRMVPKRKTDLKDLLMEVDLQNFQIRRLVLDHTEHCRSSRVNLYGGIRCGLFGSDTSTSRCQKRRQKP